jgi:hypothetical protein
MKNRTMSRSYLLILLVALVVLSSNVIAQDFDEGREPVTFESVVDELIHSAPQTIRVRNKTIDFGVFSIRKIGRLFPDAKIDSGKLILDKNLVFENCRLLGKGISNIDITNLALINCEIESITLSSIKASSLEVSESTLKGIRLINSTFDRVKLEANTNNTGFGSMMVFKSKINFLLQVEDNNFYQNIGVVSSEIENIRFKDNKSSLTGFTNNKLAGEVQIIDESTEEFMLRANEFLEDSIPAMLAINAEKLVLLKNNFAGPVQFADSKVATKVEIANNNFTQPADFHDVAFPEFNKYIPFHQFQQGFVVYKSLYAEESPDGSNCLYCELYAGQTEEELADKTNFDKLVQSYEIFFLGYKSTGDIESANMSYIRIKDLYLNRLRYLYNQNGGFSHYFRWKLAQLLKFYTNHGTDPALSILISIYVILIFAVFYFFYPSEWDITSKARLLADFKDFAEKNDKGRLKPFLALVVGFAISVVNAITLSLNSFVTLGFGTIPTTGAARYVCILQGFIGWFLLSIFTVSLINQILF